MPKESASALKARSVRVYEYLRTEYPDAHCALNYRNAFELLVATILSAQCTDARVNLVTPQLFERFPTALAMSQASLQELEQLVHTTGFYRNKAQSLLTMSKRLCDSYQGQVPQTMEELTTLRGVARKTANVVLGNAFQKNVGMVVDTHVGRVTRRLGFTKQVDPQQVEKDLMKLFFQTEWTLWAHLLIYHGRSYCTARNPKCESCPVLHECPRVGLPPLISKQSSK